jgi:hypothetical protein
MSEIARIVVPWDVQRLSPNRRVHFLARAVLVKAARAAAKLAWLDAGSPFMDGPVEVSLIIRRGRPIDPDNALAGAKSILDQLLTIQHGGCGMVEDDSAKFVRYAPVQFETGREWIGREEVVVVIRSLGTIRGEL